MNGVNYTFDDNGNLLRDGVNTYVYDSANRLISVNGTETYTYNGLGDRLTQNGTQYVLDLNAGLTQVLSDRTNSYLYGNGRISQTGSVTEYFLGDALGSVRQLTDPNGEITLAKSYNPYGNVTLSSGDGTSPFAYTGEQQDASGLTYLRARYYSSGDGRFLSRDTWGGDYINPLSLNRWMYVEGNPVNRIDPTGHIAEGHDARTADVIRGKLRVLYGVEIEKDWGYVKQYAPSGVALPTCVWKEGNWGSADEFYNVLMV
ncbi:MAG: RHS repeat-associated core domain-containing protein [Anaerolineales bacterium]|nr:RHS repeat-associated core domain-containing protein [Anaerolineales bacterium]